MDIGSVFFERSPSFVSRGIRWFGRARGEARTKCSHVGIGCGPNHITHATWPRVRQQAWDKYRRSVEDSGGDWLIMRRRRELTTYEKQMLTSYLDRMTRVRVCGYDMPRWYAVGEIPLQALDRAWGKLTGRPSFCARRLGTVLPLMVCSGMAARALLIVDGIPTVLAGAPAWAADPDDLLDYTESTAGKAEWVLDDCSPNWTRKRSA